MRCNHCEATIEAPAKFCSQCGHALNTKPVVTPNGPVIKRKMPLWFKCLTGLALIALVVVSAGILFTERFVDVVDNQLEALREGKIETAYSAYTSKDFQVATSKQDFEQFLARYPFFLHNQSASFTRRSLEQSLGFRETLTRGIIRGQLISDDKESTPVEYRVIKENNKWKILSIRLLKPYEATVGKRKKSAITNSNAE